ncbi:MAG TPA: hypothetical protein VGX71_05330 [Pseudaminobacter sp.]|nr:hypothetical protein [Pseudaminobacter sp.]
MAILAACIVVIEFNHDNSASPPHKQGGPHRVLTPQATVGVDRPSCFVEAGVALVEAIEEPEMPRMRQCAVDLLDLMKDRGCSLIASWQYSTGCRPNIPGGTVEQKSLI